MPSPASDPSPILQALSRLAADAGLADAVAARVFLAQGQLPLDALSVRVQSAP